MKIPPAFPRKALFLIAAAALAPAASAALPTSLITASATSVRVGDKVDFLVSGSDTDGNLHYINLDQISPNAGWYGAGVTSDDHIPPSGAAFNIGVNRYNYTRKVTITFGATGTYVFKGAVHDSAGSGWQVGPSSVTVVVSAQTAPSITTQPAGGTAIAGMDFNLRVSATGGGLTYQWRKGGSNISGATNATLVLSSVTTAAAGNYDVVISNTAGTTTSSSVALSVTDPNTDSDGDGLPNLSETALGTSASSTTNDSSNTQQQNIHRPTS